VNNGFNINNITICGNITKDPELRFTPGGNAVTTFSIAVNRRVQDKNTMNGLKMLIFLMLLHGLGLLRIVRRA
jgi:single stranded DNA-binding protein